MYTIVGSGIAGLTCSSILSKSGIQNEIYEKNNKIIDQHYGIQISPNASYVLDQKGLLESLTPSLKIINSIKILSLKNLKIISSLPIGNFVKANNLTNYYTASRHQLYRLLREDVESSNTPIRYQSEIIKVEDSNQEIHLINKNGSTIKKENLIIANGNSKNSIYKNISHENNKNNYITLRTNVKNIDLPFEFQKDSVFLILGEQLHIVIYPFFNDELNIVLISNKKLIDNNLKVDPKKISSIDKGVRKFILECNWSSWQLYDRKTTLNLENNLPIYVIGDAAHSIKPHLAQGSAMALEDAYSLAKLIITKNKTQDIHNLSKLRKRRINRVIDKSSQNRYIFHAPTPISIIRDLILKNTNGENYLNSLKWLYCYKS